MKICAFVIAVLMLTGLALSGICFAEETIRINGSGNALDMMRPLIDAYRKKNPDVSFIMEKPLGSSGSIKALLGGALDLAVSGKKLKPDEIARGAREQEYGKIPLIFVTEKNVPHSNITTKELQDIYNGRMVQWKNNMTIRLILRPEGDVDTIMLRAFSPAMNSAIDAARARPGMITAITDVEAYEVIAKTPGGFGMTGLCSIIVQKLPLNILPLNGVKPSPKTVADGTYPLSKEVLFITPPNTSAAVLEFLNFIYSAQGRAVAEKTGVLVTKKATKDL